jgi:hypothetical protein
MYEDDYTPRWSLPQLAVAISLIPLGWLCSMVGLGAGLGAGVDSWIYPIAGFAFLAGPWIMGAGALWLAVQIVVGPFPIKRISLRTLLILVTLIALALGAAAVM